MKALHVALPYICLLASLAINVPAADQERIDPVPDQQAPLQLIIGFPRERAQVESPDAENLFVSHLTRAFRIEGYAGKVNHRSSENADVQAQTLVIQIVRWHVDRFGTPECQFKADLVLKGTTTSLGEFSASEMTGGAKDREQSLRWVAERALRKLVVKIRSQKLLPGFGEKKKKQR